MDIDVTIGNDVTMRGGSAASVGRIDQYELVRELGGGGFGCVYLAKDTVAGIEVAVKGLPPEVKHNKEELENIRANFALVSRLHHPNIAAALVLHPAKEVSYANRDAMEKLRVFERDTMMVMEYAPGVTLSQWRKQFPEKKVPFEKALDITRQVAAALDYAHGEKIVHRDVKPSNVMIETKPDGAVVARVLDFGLAAEIRSSMGRVSREIRDTSGTRPYMAPEQWRGAKQGPATDQYALAAMFCELVTGEVPFASVFETGDPVVMLTNVTTLPPELPDSLPRGCRKALLRALAKKPEERFGSCGALAAALGGTRSCASVGKVWLVVTLLVALALAAVGGWWWRERVKSEALRVKNEALAAERARKEAEDRRKAEEAKRAEAARKEAEDRRKAEEAKRKADEARLAAEKAEAERKAKVEAGRVAEEKAEAERKAKAAADKAEAERKAKEESERLAEESRKAAAEKAAAERKAKAAEEERLKKEEIQRLVNEALAKQKEQEAQVKRVSEPKKKAVGLSAAAKKLLGRWRCECQVEYQDSLGSRASDAIKRHLPVSSTISLECREDGTVELSDSSGRSFGSSAGTWKYRHGMLMMELTSDDGRKFLLSGVVNWRGDSFELHYDNGEYANMIRKSCGDIPNFNVVNSTYVDGRLEVSISTKMPNFMNGTARCSAHVFRRQ